MPFALIVNRRKKYGDLSFMGLRWLARDVIVETARFLCSMWS